MKVLIMAITILANLIMGTGYGDVVEPGLHIVGASIEPGFYLVQINVYQDIEGSNTLDASLVPQPPNPEDGQAERCTTIAYSDYWTENRGWSISGGWGIFKVRPEDYAIYIDCPMISVPENYSPQTPFSQAVLNAYAERGAI